MNTGAGNESMSLARGRAKLFEDARKFDRLRERNVHNGNLAVQHALMLLADAYRAAARGEGRQKRMREPLFLT